ncbi:hypothetical protein FB451DRAFT_67417 [Mycena latifolia]|nr:hypothetical protein FB451DRAFT_67417 [Mycena latifolia]
MACIWQAISIFSCTGLRVPRPPRKHVAPTSLLCLPFQREALVGSETSSPEGCSLGPRGSPSSDIESSPISCGMILDRPLCAPILCPGIRSHQRTRRPFLMVLNTWMGLSTFVGVCDGLVLLYSLTAVHGVRPVGRVHFHRLARRCSCHLGFSPAHFALGVGRLQL